MRTGKLKHVILPALLAAGLCGQTLQQAERLWQQHDTKGANNIFRALVNANPKNPDYKVRWGRLLLEGFNKKDAAELFGEALELKKDHAGALLGLALVAAESFEGKAMDLAQQALAADPKLFEAEELMARLALEDNDPKAARRHADAALAISAEAKQAMAIHAAADWLEDKKDSRWMDQLLAKDPHYGAGYATVAHFFSINRRYEEAIGYYRKAVELEPNLWSAHAELGVSLMQLGNEVEARQQLELCYNNGYRNSETVNSLRLLDSFKNFETFKTGNTILRLHKKEAEILRPYFEAEMKRAMATYEKKYAFKLDRPVQVEVYPDHEDFAVRTMGMPGLGALGVTFGYVVAMDSPSGRRPGSFHWASTMWHELSHVYLLTITHFRVPRWFTEGVAVHEETATMPDWGDRLTPDVIAAIKDKKLLPIAQLDRGFIHPKAPAQVIVSYFQAGKICDYIAQKWGEKKLLEMTHAFAETQSTEDVVEKHLGMKPEEFDKQFLGALEAETKKTVEGFAEWRKKVKEVAELAKAGKHDEVIREGTAIRDLYPDYVESGSVYEFLATAYSAKNEKTAALAELERYSRIGGREPATLKKLATLLEEAGRPKEAAAALERLNFIAPIDEDLHRRLGTLLLNQGNDAAITEFRAVLAAKPLDQAASHFNLAKAYKAARNPEAAKDELLLALEAAPGFRPAQKMLLEISAGPAK